MRTGLISSLLMLMLYTPAGAQTLGTRDSNASHPPANTANTPAHREDYDPLLDLPPLPHNQVTLIGGVVASLDEVMNRMSLHPFGSNQKMEVRFDTRTKFYQDGKPISYRDIKQGQRVYVDTMLNGSKVSRRAYGSRAAPTAALGAGRLLTSMRSAGG